MGMVLQINSLPNTVTLPSLKTNNRDAGNDLDSFVNTTSLFTKPFHIYLSSLIPLMTPVDRYYRAYYYFHLMGEKIKARRAYVA